VFQSQEISPMQLIFLSEAENLVADLDTGDFLESPTFDRKYLNVPESKFLPLMLQKYCYLPTKLVKILFSLEIVQKKTKSKANSAAISGFLSNKYYKRIISLLESAENAYQLRPDQWSLILSGRNGRWLEPFSVHYNQTNLFL
jgi:hypothetical protein